MATGIPRAQAPATPIRYRRSPDRLTRDQFDALRWIDAKRSFIDAAIDERKHEVDGAWSLFAKRLKD